MHLKPLLLMTAPAALIAHATTAPAQSFCYVIDRNRRFRDISGIGIDRHQIVAIPLTPSMTGEKEPEVIAGLEEALLEAIELLPIDQAQVFVMHELEGKSFEEILRLFLQKIL